MQKIISYINKLLEVSVVTMLAIMACLVFLNVVLRYGFNSSFIMTEEVSRYLFLWVIFLGSVLAFNEGGHVNVSAFIDKLSDRARLILSLFTDSLMFYCCILISFGSYQQMLLNMENYAPISNIPIGINFLACLLMGLMIGLLLLLRLFTHVTALLRRRA